MPNKVLFQYNNFLSRICQGMFGMIGLLMFILMLLASCSSDEGNATGSNSNPLPKPEPEPTTQRTVNVDSYGGTLNENLKSIVGTQDGGFVVLGYVQSNDGDVDNKETTDFDYWLLKFNSLSELQWQKSYGGSLNDRGNEIIQSTDGGFLLLGFSESADGDAASNAGSLDYWLVKTDADGNLQWQKSYGFKGRDEGISVIETQDGGYMLVGVLDVTASEGQGISSAKNHAGGDYWAVKLNGLGELQWSNYYGGTFTDTANAVIELEEGGFLIAGSSDSFDVDISSNRGTYDFWVVRISEIGELIWEKNYGGSEIDEPHAIVAAKDGNYLIVGDTRSSDQQVTNNKGAADVWAVTINLEGDLIWERTYGGSGFDAARSISKTNVEGFLITGSSRSADGDLQANQGQNDAWIIQIDDVGNLVWQESIGGSQIDVAYDVAQLQNGNVVVVGESASNDGDIVVNKGFTDALLITIREEVID